MRSHNDVIVRNDVWNSHTSCQHAVHKRVDVVHHLGSPPLLWTPSYSVAGTAYLSLSPSFRTPQKNIHAILLEELEHESKYWISNPEDITAKITDDLWEVPGNNSAGGHVTMPDEHLWRFSADVGLYNQEEEVCVAFVVNFGTISWRKQVGIPLHPANTTRAECFTMAAESSRPAAYETRMRWPAM